jgi:MSHA biogenesis protein MshM
MYLDHFNLSRFPFPNAADIEHFFGQGNRNTVLKALQYAILNEEGLTTVIGRIGVGKTTLLRLLVKTVSPIVETVVIDDPRLSAIEFLETIAVQLHLAIPNGSNSRRIRDILIPYLRQKAREQRRVVIMIDESQYISDSVLEEVHLLSNLENNEKRLLQWVLFGQPQMEEQLSGIAAAPLKDRIINRISIAPLELDEIASYIRFRLDISGYKGPPLFDRSCIKLIANLSYGSLRKIHLLSHKALMSAYAKGLHQVEPEHVLLANQENEEIRPVLPFYDADTILAGEDDNPDNSVIVLEPTVINRQISTRTAQIIFQPSERWWQATAIITSATIWTIAWNMA